ncbi:MAG: hypothetical protein H0W71_03115 [Sphingomonas sp.]|nr:hypothetical protein [Sphingomonas sp.]
MRIVALTSLADVSIQVELADGNLPSFRPGASFKIPLWVTNTSDRSILWSHQNPLDLSYRWLSDDGKVVERDGRRSLMPVQSLAPGMRVEVKLEGVSPEVVGSYTLQISLVLEGVHWACDVGAAGWVQLETPVSTMPAWPIDLRTSRGGRALRGALVAAELARSIGEITFDVRAAARVGADDPDLFETESVSTKHRSILQTFRDQLRGLLGLRELEQQLKAGFVVAGKQEKIIRNLDTQLVSIRDSLRTEFDEASDRARQFADRLSETRLDLKSHLYALEQASQSRTDKVSGRSLGGTVFGPRASQPRDQGEASIIGRAGPGVDKIAKARDSKPFSLPAASLILVRTSYGLLAIPDDDLAAIAHYSGDVPEAATVAVVDGVLGPGDEFFDVGAGLGLYTLVAGRRVGRRGSMHTFERAPLMRALRTTLVVNGLAEITHLHQHASGLIEQLTMLNKPALIKFDFDVLEPEALKKIEAVIRRTKDCGLIVGYSAGSARSTQFRKWINGLVATGLKAWAIDDREMSLRFLGSPSELPEGGAWLFLARILPAKLKSMCHDR